MIQLPPKKESDGQWAKRAAAWAAENLDMVGGGGERDPAEAIADELRKALEAGVSREAIREALPFYHGSRAENLVDDLLDEQARGWSAPNADEQTRRLIETIERDNLEATADFAAEEARYRALGNEPPESGSDPEAGPELVSYDGHAIRQALSEFAPRLGKAVVSALLSECAYVRPDDWGADSIPGLIRKWAQDILDSGSLDKSCPL